MLVDDEPTMTEGWEDPAEHAQEEVIPLDRLLKFAETDGDISALMTDRELTSLGNKVVEDWEYDLRCNEKWRNQAKKALDAAAQEPGDKKNYPWDQASNIKWPSITVAAQQFAARAYPAIVKNDEAIGVKVLGKKPDKQAAQPVMPGQPVPIDPAVEQWEAKERRADRVKDWLNYRLFYGMPDWEGDMDAALNQIPVIGMGFKKVYKSPRYGVCSEYVSAFHVTVHPDTKSLETCPRITHDYTMYPYELASAFKRGEFRDISKDMVDHSDDDQKPRCILEQHRMHDLDDDGVDEPYIVTVDKETAKVLRIEAAYGPSDVLTKDGQVVDFIRFTAFTAFPFIPDPRGKFYALGFGSLLEMITEAINAGVNQLIDSGHAAVAGGGFISQGLRIQGGGQTSTLRMRPGEYKMVNTPAGSLNQNIYERTVPQPSAVLFEMLGMLIDQAKDISAVKDVLTGDAPTNAPVGTTMALIEQGLQSFTAIYKRIYRALKAEFKLLYQCESRWGGEEAATAYKEFFDGDPEADFEADFDPKGYDIVPVSDPTVVTQAQKLAKAEYVKQFIGHPLMDDVEIIKRALEAAGEDDIDSLFKPHSGPDPMMVEAATAELDKTKSETDKNQAQALKYAAEAGAVTGQMEVEGAINAAVDTDEGRLPSMGGEPGNAMGNEGLVPQGGGMPSGMDQPDMGQPDAGNQPIQPAGDEGLPAGY